MNPEQPEIGDLERAVIEAAKRYYLWTQIDYLLNGELEIPDSIATRRVGVDRARMDVIRSVGALRDERPSTAELIEEMKSEYCEAELSRIITTLENEGYT